MAPFVVVAGAVAVVQPFAHERLPAQPSFVPVMLAVVACFDVLSVVLLVAQFRDKGERRALALSWAYMFSLVVLLGWAAAFPGVLAAQGVFGTAPSTAPWLWVFWHAAFPVLIGAALAPWPEALDRPVDAARRRRLAIGTVAASTVAGALVVGAVVVFDDSLPVVIQGTDTTQMTRVAGPVMLPLVVLATLVACAGAWRRGGAARWAALAATASLADVVLTLFSYHRFSLGWYAGRTMTVVSAGVVLVALLGEFNGVKRQLAREGERLRVLFEHTDALERLQHTLLAHMAGGVLMHDRHGRVVAANATAAAWLGGDPERLDEWYAAAQRWDALRPDGTAWGAQDLPWTATARTGSGHHDRVLGLRAGDGTVRWLSVSSTTVLDDRAAVDYVVTSLTDITEQHAAVLAGVRERHSRRRRITDVLAAGGPAMVFQPIVALDSGDVVGVEALARFAAAPLRPPNEWFDDAAEAGLGTELELAAVGSALSKLNRLPRGVYLSVNASPTTVTSAALHELLADAHAERVVLELTEHAGVEDYEVLQRSLERLRALGTRLAVDDAGAGFASLRHILNLRPDVIKLDIGLVRGIDTDPARRALAGALTRFAGEISAQVVAEGIEHAAERHVLSALGIRYGQGYHLGRPAPLPALEALASSR